MLEYWYKEKRTLVDFRRGPLGPHFDGFAAYLKARKYSYVTAIGILGRSCQFNAFLIERGIDSCREITKSLVEPFLQAYLGRKQAVTVDCPARKNAVCGLERLFGYLVDTKVLKLHEPPPVKRLYDWLLNPYLRHLREERGLAKATLQRVHTDVGLFLEALGRKAERRYFKVLRAEMVENYWSLRIKEDLKNLTMMACSLRGFFKYCAVQKHTRMDFSDLIPPVRRYRHASLPRGMEDSALESMLATIDRNTPNGARDYAIMVLMMGYGLRGISVAELLLDDIDWQRSRIRIRAQKGGKEVVLPLIDSVGEAIVDYLRHRFDKAPFREVFLTVKAPVRPLNSLVISHIVRNYLSKAGITMAGAGARTLRHSWAIRALANDSPIKSIADVLGHRYIDTTFIYAKADLKTLRGAAMPWPEKG